MTEILEGRPGETLVASSAVPKDPWLDRREFRFGFVVTTVAVYVPLRKRGFALTEPLAALRIPLQDIREMSLEPASAFQIQSLAGLFLVGLWAVGNIFRMPGSTWSSLGTLIFLVGLAIQGLLGARGRWRLRIATVGENLDFTPPPYGGRSSAMKERAFAAQRAFLTACASVGVVVHQPEAPLPQPIS
jgi:hypothetical protein